MQCELGRIHALRQSGINVLPLFALNVWFSIDVYFYSVVHLRFPIHASPAANFTFNAQDWRQRPALVCIKCTVYYQCLFVFIKFCLISSIIALPLVKVKKKLCVWNELLFLKFRYLFKITFCYTRNNFNNYCTLYLFSI